MSWRPIGVHHTALETSNLEATIEFYTEILGFSVKALWGDKPERIAMLELSTGGRIEVFEREHPAQIGGPVIHFALQTRDCRAAIDGVRAAGCRILGNPQTHDIAAFPRAFSAVVAFCEGPNGERIEFIEAEWL